MSRGEDTAWETGWGDHQVQQRQRLARLTLADKIEWLEDAQRLVQNLSAAPTGSSGTTELARPATAGLGEVP